MGARETKDVVVQVYSFPAQDRHADFAVRSGRTRYDCRSGRLGRREGVAELLIFLTMLSANLAVINFLPIPLLDGGHMAFLICEGIMRRPVSERVVRGIPLPRLPVHHQPDALRAGARFGGLIPRH